MEKTRQHIGILKHEKIGYAEELLLEILKTTGAIANIINPCDIVFGDNTEQFPDIVLARCELSSFSDMALSAYLTYFGECLGRGIPVVNSREFLLRGQDKYLTHQALHNHMVGIGITDDINPPTWFVHNKEQAYAIALGEISNMGSVVLKHPCSGRGEGVYLVRNEEELGTVLSGFFANANQPILIQRTIQKETNEQGGYRDMRLWVCRDHETDEPQVVGAFYRNAEPGKFHTNICRGSCVSRMEKVDDRLAYYAKLVMDATQGDVAGLDFVKDMDGKYWFEEVNIAFETSPEAVRLVGAEIWYKVARLLRARMHFHTANSPIVNFCHKIPIVIH